MIREGNCSISQKRVIMSLWLRMDKRSWKNFKISPIHLMYWSTCRRVVLKCKKEQSKRMIFCHRLEALGDVNYSVKVYLISMLMIMDKTFSFSCTACQGYAYQTLHVIEDIWRYQDVHDLYFIHYKKWRNWSQTTKELLVLKCLIQYKIKF